MPPPCRSCLRQCILATAWHDLWSCRERAVLAGGTLVSGRSTMHNSLQPRVATDGVMYEAEDRFWHSGLRRSRCLVRIARLSATLQAAQGALGVPRCRDVSRVVHCGIVGTGTCAARYRRAQTSGCGAQHAGRLRTAGNLEPTFRVSPPPSSVLMSDLPYTPEASQGWPSRSTPPSDTT